PADRQKACFLSIDQQLDVWRRALTDNGFTVDVFTVAEDTFTMAREHAIASFPVIMSIYKTFFETNEEFDRECGDLSDVIFDAMCYPVADRPNPNAWTQFLANENITEVVYRAQLLTLIYELLNLCYVYSANIVPHLSNLGANYPDPDAPAPTPAALNCMFDKKGDQERACAVNAYNHWHTVEPHSKAWCCDSYEYLDCVGKIAADKHGVR
ncbi:unnamed protein product, partial [Medioppia subpectinata]